MEGVSVSVQGEWPQFSITQFYITGEERGRKDVRGVALSAASREKSREEDGWRKWGWGGMQGHSEQPEEEGDGVRVEGWGVGVVVKVGQREGKGRW